MKTKKQKELDDIKKRNSGAYDIAKAYNQMENIADTIREKMKPLTDIGRVKELMNSKDKFNPHGDYSIIYFNGQKHKLTPMQANAIRYMVAEHKNGKEEIFDKDILDCIGTSQLTMSAVFKKTTIMGNVISKVYNNYYKLNI
tara:strand:- start:42 stop:467 length:426 start_codon:yes stop_codon:yes gene_type:complete